MKRKGIILLVGLALTASACGEIDLNSGPEAGMAYCEDMGGRFHFKTLVPPWKYNKEYRCTRMDGRNCVGTWQATGRYVYVVSDIPFVNLDSEIVTLMHVEMSSGGTAQRVRDVIIDKSIGQPGSNAEFYDEQEYPREIAYGDGLSGHDVLWRQKREFEGRSYNWYRRDVFLKGDSGQVYHLEFYSIGPLDRPEFDTLISTFREGPSPDGAPDCSCQDEHDPNGPQPC